MSPVTRLATALPSRELPAERDRRLIEIGRLALERQHHRVIGAEAIVAHEAGLLLVRQFRQMPRQLLDEGVVELERQQVRIGEVAIVVRLFLGPHRAGLAQLRVEQPRLLVDRAAILQNVDLAARLVFDRLAGKAHRIDVLDLAARAELAARLAHRDVDVGPHRTLLHIAVAGAEIAQDRAQLG